MTFRRDGLHRTTLLMTVLVIVLVTSTRAPAQSPDETTAPEKKAAQQEHEPKQPPPPQHEPTAAEIAAKESVASSLLRNFQSEEYEVRSAAQAVPADKYNFRPRPGNFGGVYPGYGPKEMRTFAEQIKHVACANFAFAAELDGKQPPPACDKGGPNPSKTRAQLLTYLRNSFAALNKSLNAVSSKNMYDPIEAPYAN